MQIMLLQFNNYFNRQVKRFNDIDSYLPYQVGTIVPNVNFNPADGISTELIINYKEPTNPDYLIAFNPDGSFNSRWFIMDSLRTRSGQFDLKLRRDVVADYYENIITAPCYVEKGFVNTNNPLIFNREGLKFNEIKTSETLLKDNTKTAWIVGYASPKVDEKDPVFYEGVTAQSVIPDFKNFQYKEYIGKTITSEVDVTRTYTEIYLASITFDQETFGKIPHKKGRIILNGNNELIEPPDNYLAKNSYVIYDRIKEGNTLDVVCSKFAQFKFGITKAMYERLLESHASTDFVKDLNAERDKVYYDSDNKRYVKIKFKPKGTLDRVFLLNNTDYPASYEQIDAELVKFVLDAGYTKVNGLIRSEVFAEQYELTLEEVVNPNTVIKVNYSKTTSILKDAPYKMFCIPYEGSFGEFGKDVLYKYNRLFSLNVATTLINGLQPASGTAGGKLYDIQLLPYCPISDWFIEDKGIMKLKGEYTNGVDFDYITDAGGSTNLGMIFYPNVSSFSQNIACKIDIPAGAIDFKVNRETTKYRLCSPNYSNFEDFDPYMNNGVDYINVDATYKPYTPYIKLNINFKNLYGSDFDDSRGLILGGDFSIPMMSDAFATYEIQNKNYSNIFDRGTQNLEVTHRADMFTSGFGAIAGTASAGVLGGSFLGPIGAGIGAGLSAAGGVADMAIKDSLHKEQMDMRKDMYTFNLQNIQAKPQGLVKTSSFNINNKLIPFIEVYKSTDIEKTALTNKIIYNGMTLNVIGTIEDYINPTTKTFVKGQIIRIEGLNEDNHLSETIAEEINKGVYL